MSGTHDEIPPPPPPLSINTIQKLTTTNSSNSPQTQRIKLLFSRKGDDDIWAKKIEHVTSPIQTSNLGGLTKMDVLYQSTLDTTGQIKILPPKTAEEMVLRERERKARTTLLMAIPEDHLAKFHKMTDAKDISLPSAWLQVSLIMRNKPGMDSLSFDDLYNNLRVFENDVKGSTASSSNLQNIAFVSENTNSTNEVSTA
ncbi:hypothetical protein Tco_0471190 [Tanacetum coccineum]